MSKRKALGKNLLNLKHHIKGTHKNLTTKHKNNKVSGLR